MPNSDKEATKKFDQLSFIDLGIGRLAAGDAVKYLSHEEFEANFPIKKEASPYYERLPGKIIVSEAAFAELAKIISKDHV